MKATNNYVFIKRDAVQETTKANFIIPKQGVKKPHRGDIVSVGYKTADPNIVPEAKALFHEGIGFEIEVDGEIFLVLQEHEIIAIL